MVNKRTEKLAEIVGTQSLVQFDRTPVDRYRITGYVVGLSERLVLIHLVQDQVMNLNGYVGIRRSDIKRYKVFSSDGDFMPRVLPLLRIEPIPRPDLDTTGIFSLLSSAREVFPVLGIETEVTEPDAVFIGTVENLSSRAVVLRQIDTAGCWMEPTEFRLKDITKVILGDGYQEALALLTRHEAKDKERQADAA